MQSNEFLAEDHINMIFIHHNRSAEVGLHVALSSANHYVSVCFWQASRPKKPGNIHVQCTHIHTFIHTYMHTLSIIAINLACRQHKSNIDFIQHVDGK